MIIINKEDVMELREAIERLNEKFTSGNSIEVERNIILRKEWIPIREALEEKEHNKE